MVNGKIKPVNNKPLRKRSKKEPLVEKTAKDQNIENQIKSPDPKSNAEVQLQISESGVFSARTVVSGESKTLTSSSIDSVDCNQPNTSKSQISSTPLKIPNPSALRAKQDHTPDKHKLGELQSISPKVSRSDWTTPNKTPPSAANKPILSELEKKVYQDISRGGLSNLPGMLGIINHSNNAKISPSTTTNASPKRLAHTTTVVNGDMKFTMSPKKKSPIMSDDIGNKKPPKFFKSRHSPPEGSKKPEDKEELPDIHPHSGKNQTQNSKQNNRGAETSVSTTNSNGIVTTAGLGSGQCQTTDSINSAHHSEFARNWANAQIRMALAAAAAVGNNNNGNLFQQPMNMNIPSLITNNYCSMPFKNAQQVPQQMQPFINISHLQMLYSQQQNQFFAHQQLFQQPQLQQSMMGISNNGDNNSQAHMSNGFQQSHREKESNGVDLSLGNKNAATPKKILPKNGIHLNNNNNNNNNNNDSKQTNLNETEARLKNGQETSAKKLVQNGSKDEITASSNNGISNGRDKTNGIDEKNTQDTKIVVNGENGYANINGSKTDSIVVNNELQPPLPLLCAQNSSTSS